MLKRGYRERMCGRPSLSLFIVTMVMFWSPGQSGAFSAGPCPEADALALTLTRAALRAACLEPRRERSEAQTRQAWAGVDERRAALASQWSVQSSPSFSAQRGLGGTVSTTTSVHSASGGLSLNLGRTLWDGGARRARWVQGENDAMAAGLDERDTALDSEATFLGLWVDTRLAEAKLLAARAALLVAQASVAAAQARAELGDATQVELLAAESSRAQAQRDQVNAELSLTKAHGLLAMRMGWPKGQRLELSGDDSLALGPVPDTPALLAQHPQALAQQLRVQALKSALEAVRAEGGASLSLNSQLGPNASRSNGSGAGARSSTSLQGSVGLSFNLPLSDGGSRSAAVARARAQLDAALAAHAEVLRSLEEAWWRAESDWRSALADERSSNVALRAAFLSEQAQRGRYAAGVGRLSELLQAQSELSQRQRQLDEARAYRLRSHAALRQAAGLSALTTQE